MNESYMELLVKKENTIKDTLIRIICIALTISAALLSLTGAGMIALVAAVVLGILTYIIWLNTDIEYEYLYLDKELSIDKIMSKTKRKRAATFQIDRMEILAPADSYHLGDYKNRTFQISDYSSGVRKQPDKRFVMIYNGTQKIYFTEEVKFAQVIKNIAPRKVFFD